MSYVELDGTGFVRNLIFTYPPASGGNASRSGKSGVESTNLTFRFEGCRTLEGFLTRDAAVSKLFSTCSLTYSTESLSTFVIGFLKRLPVLLIKDLEVVESKRDLA